MKQLERYITRKLHSNKGETIGETLVALLISALALLMLAGSITSSTGLVTRSREKMDEYYDKNAELVELNNANNATIKITEINGVTGLSYSIKYVKNDAVNDLPVVAFNYHNEEGTNSGT